MPRELRDIFPTPYIKHSPTPRDLLVTVLKQPSSGELQQASQLYQQETRGFPGEMTQSDLNKYLNILRSRRQYYG